ncbi:MAG: hypothetical protein WA416_12690 [Candidatus Sulfotelmatobacter sp.]
MARASRSKPFGLGVVRQPVLAFIPAPPDTRFLAFGFGSGPAVVSPDETRLAFTAIDHDGSIKVWTRSLKAGDATTIPGADRAASPFWSPDGHSLARVDAASQAGDRGEVAVTE